MTSLVEVGDRADPQRDLSDARPPPEGDSPAAVEPSAEQLPQEVPPPEVQVVVENVVRQDGNVVENAEQQDASWLHEGPMQRERIRRCREFCHQQAGSCRKFYHRHFTKDRWLSCLVLCTCTGCCCVVILFLIFFFVGLIIAYTETRRDDSLWAEDMTDCGSTDYCSLGQGKLLTPANMTRYIAYSGCNKGWKNDEEFDQCGGPCFSHNLPRAMDEFNRNRSWYIATFPSRRGPPEQEVVQITAWVLPAEDPSGMGRPPPRVVLQHGNNANSNSRKVQAMAYMLRSMGFSAIVPDIRGHGKSQRSSNTRTTWGWEYPYDLLGAWDYAVNDPDGYLGGRVSPSEVGCLGESMGAFLCATAFGMEPRMAGAWVDSAVYDPYTVAYAAPVLWDLGLKTPMTNYVLAHLLLKFMDWWDWRLTGVDLAYNSPGNDLPRGPATARPIVVVHSSIDSFVPMDESYQLIGLLGTLPLQYRLFGVFFPACDCNGNSHSENYLCYPDEYRRQLCLFWSFTFKRNETLCGLGQLPRLRPDATGAMMHNDVVHSELLNGHKGRQIRPFIVK